MYMARYVKDTAARNLAPPDMYETMYIMGYVPYQPVQDCFPSTAAFGGEKYRPSCWHASRCHRGKLAPKHPWDCYIYLHLPPQNLHVLEVCMVNNLVFSWPETFMFHGLGGDGTYTFTIKKPFKCIGKYGPVRMDGVGEPDPTWKNKNINGVCGSGSIVVYLPPWSLTTRQWNFQGPPTLGPLSHTIPIPLPYESPDMGMVWE